MKAYQYDVSKETGFIDYDVIAEAAARIKPLILLAGYSSYPRNLDFSILRDIAKRNGAVLMVDMAHFAGLVAGGVLKDELNPIPYADIVTSTTHKSLRGPRGGLVMCKSHLAPWVKKACPMVMGGPLPHVIAAKSVCFKEALDPSFTQYAHQCVRNARSLAQSLKDNNINLVTSGTDNYIVVIDLTETNVTGRSLETHLSSIGVFANRNSIPFDKRNPWTTSGLRVGTPALTSRGFKEKEFEQIGHLISDVVKSIADNQFDQKKTEFANIVRELTHEFPLYPEIEC